MYVIAVIGDMSDPCVDKYTIITSNSYEHVIRICHNQNEHSARISRNTVIGFCMYCITQVPLGWNPLPAFKNMKM